MQGCMNVCVGEYVWEIGHVSSVRTCVHAVGVIMGMGIGLCCGCVISVYICEHVGAVGVWVYLRVWCAGAKCAHLASECACGSMFL